MASIFVNICLNICLIFCSTLICRDCPNEEFKGMVGCGAVVACNYIIGLLTVSLEWGCRTGILPRPCDEFVGSLHDCCVIEKNYDRLKYLN